MSELLERCLLLLIGGGIGFILGFITRSQMRIEKELHDVEETLKLDRNDDGFMRYPLVADVMALVVLIIVVFSAIQAQRAVNQLETQQVQLEKESKADDAALCSSGTDSRNVSRDIVDEIYGLVVAVVNRGDGAPPRTPEEIERTNAYIDRANAFRKRLYARIQPSEFCAPYVEDHNVKPPTPPFPHVTN